METIVRRTSIRPWMRLSKAVIALALLSAASAFSPASAGMPGLGVDEGYGANGAPVVVEGKPRPKPKPKPRCHWVNGVLVCSF